MKTAAPARGSWRRRAPKGNRLRIRGQRVRDARIAKGMTVGDLAGRARLDAETVAAIETGRQEAPIETVRRLADALGVAVEDLVMWGGET